MNVYTSILEMPHDVPDGNLLTVSILGYSLATYVKSKFVCLI